MEFKVMSLERDGGEVVGSEEGGTVGRMGVLVREPSGLSLILRNLYGSMVEFCLEGDDSVIVVEMFNEWWVKVSSDSFVIGLKCCTVKHFEWSLLLNGVILISIFSVFIHGCELLAIKNMTVNAIKMHYSNIPKNIMNIKNELFNDKS